MVLADANQIRTGNARHRGFTMVEVMVGVLFMATAFVALYLAFSSGFQFVQLARENLRAGQILTEKLETIRLYTWTQINTAGFVPTNFTATFYPPSQTNSGLVYTGAVNIATTTLTESYRTDMRQVNVSVTWLSGRSLRTRSMSTMVSQYGIQN